MKAIVHDGFGPPEGLQLRDAGVPQLAMTASPGLP